MVIYFNILNMFKINKKFKVRVDHYSQGMYVVEYTHYYLIPIYHTLMGWYEGGLLSGIECKSMKLMDIEKAENAAKNLKSINDVRKWNAKIKEQEDDFYKRKKEYYAKHVPYKTKHF